VTLESNPDIAEIAARLGGAGPLDEPRLQFTYCDVVAIVQALADQQKVAAPQPGSVDRTPVAFVLQEIPMDQEAIMTAPAIPEQERPQTSPPGTASNAGEGG
jgi:hypothetical protein